MRISDWSSDVCSSDLCRTMRVPLMGVEQKLQASRLASQLAFMMIEYIRRSAIESYGATRSEIGWVLDDNQGMNAIADAIGRKVNKVYQIYDRSEECRVGKECGSKVRTG